MGDVVSGLTDSLGLGNLFGGKGKLFGLTGDPLGLFGGSKDDSAAKAAEAQARAEASRNAALEAQANMQKNFASDLKLDNTSQVFAGGSADAATAETLKKKKAASGGLAASLGLNT